MKQVVLINHSWISPTLQKEWGLEFCLFFKKWVRVQFAPKKGEVSIIVEKWRLLRENNLCLLANLCVYKSKKHYNPRYIKVTSSIIYPNFEVNFNVYIYIYIYIYIFSCSDIASLFQEQTLLPKSCLCAHFQFNNHDLFENVDWN